MSTSNNITDLGSIPAVRGDWCPPHPGELLALDIVPATGRSKTEIARLLGISRQHLHDILVEKKPVSADVAVRLGKLFGNGPQLWLGMQVAYDTWHAQRRIDVSGIPTITATTEAAE